MRLIPKHQTPQGTSTIQVPSLLNIPGLDLQTGLARAYQSMGLASPMVDTSTPEGVSYAINQAQNNVAREEQARKEDAEAEMEFRRKNPWVTDAPGGTDTPTNLVFGGLPMAKAIFSPLNALTRTTLGKVGFGALGANNLLSKDGVAKTIGKAYAGDYSGAAVSALGDALDLAMVAPAVKLFTGANNLRRATKAIDLLVENSKLAEASEPLTSAEHTLQLPYSVIRQPNGKVRFQLPEHTQGKPRELVLEPVNDGNYRMHVRSWDRFDPTTGKPSEPGHMSTEQFTTLADAVLNELPNGGAILPPNALAHRGTLAAAMKLMKHIKESRPDIELTETTIPYDKIAKKITPPKMRKDGSVEIRPDYIYPTMRGHLSELPGLIRTSGSLKPNTAVSSLTLARLSNWRPKSIGSAKLDHLKGVIDTPSEKLINLNELKSLYPAVANAPKKDTSIMQEFADSLDEAEYYDPAFINPSYINGFRKDLYLLGYDFETLTPRQIVKLLTYRYKELTKNQTGKAKDMIFNHGGPSFDLFDMNRSGYTTSNHGIYGPGNYFSDITEINGYGNNTDLGRTYMNRGGHMTHVGVVRPFLLNNIQKIVPVGNHLGPTNTWRIKTEGMAIPDIPRLDILYVGPRAGTVKHEYVLPRDIGIKTLFSNPTSFIRDELGNIKMLTDWSNPSLYKSIMGIPVAGTLGALEYNMNQNHEQ